MPINYLKLKIGKVWKILWGMDHGRLIQGFTNIEKVTLSVGTQLDRFGHEGGRFLAPLGASFESRALPISSNVPSDLKFYKVIKPLQVDAGPAIPWFNQKGMGTQYFTGEKNIAQLIDEGYLKRITCK